MTVTHTIIPAKDLIKITVSGQLDSKTIKKIVANLAKARGLAVEYDILLDGRQAHSRITDSHLLALVGMLASIVLSSATRLPSFVLVRNPPKLDSGNGLIGKRVFGSPFFTSLRTL